MNDIVLSSLVNLLALSGADSKMELEKAKGLVNAYLKSSFAIRDPQSYIDLYVDLRGFYDEAPDLDRMPIVENVCSKIHGLIAKSDQGSVMLRLMEFCCAEVEFSDPAKAAEILRSPVLLKAAECLEVSNRSYEKYSDFITGTESDFVKVFHIGEGEDAGTLRTLFLKGHNTLIFSWHGPKPAMMNDIPVGDGVFQLWQQSGVLKGHGFKPLYYSTIVRAYGQDENTVPVELCGRGVDFRFKQGGDNGMHNFTFTLHSGELVAIMGGSGVGKSTLLSLLNGSLRPQKGTITINGHDISEPEAKAMIGFVPQDDLLIEELTVYENLWYTAKLCFEGMPDDQLDRKVMSVLTQLGLDQARDLKVGSAINKYISGGQRKRLNIALELIREPAILFLDEPTSGLSSTDTEKVVNLLKEQTGKGRLIVTNIHQPSSDVYKLFDRLWLLDKGGYPIYDGNPIDAITWFKTAAGYVDADVSACSLCGNVNPELVLNIIDEKSIDTTGKISEERKVSPQQWHDLYVSRREEGEDPKTSALPENGQKKPGALKQMWIFLQRNFRSKMTNLQYILVTLLEAPALAAICALLTHYVPDGAAYSVMDNKNIVSYFFMAIIVAIFFGMSGSAEEIIKDRALLKREEFLNLSYRSYIWSKIVFMSAVALVQTLLFILVGNSIMKIEGLFWSWWLILFISEFLSGLIGLLLSQRMNSVVAIYITIPLLLIPQILLCGLVVKFEDLNPNSETGNVPVIGDVIPSRWAFEALAVTSFSDNKYEKQFFEKDRARYEATYFERSFAYELDSQIETREFELKEGLPEKPEHMMVVRTELPRLTAFCGMNPYEGDWSYESLHTYILEAQSILSRRSNRTTLDLDKQVSAYIKAHSTEELKQLKRANYNIQLENLVLNRDTKHTHTVVGSHIVPRCGYIFLTPQSKIGRAPFYSGVKCLGDTEIPTFWYNLGVLLLMSILCGVVLTEKLFK